MGTATQVPDVGWWWGWAPFEGTMYVSSYFPDGYACRDEDGEDDNNVGDDNVYLVHLWSQEEVRRTLARSHELDFHLRLSKIRTVMIVAMMMMAMMMIMKTGSPPGMVMMMMQSNCSW